MHYRGKQLTIVSDCSYSGHWVKDCINVLDSEGILSCGHHTRERGILLKIMASCEAGQQAKMLAYVQKGMLVKGSKIHALRSKHIAGDQVPIFGDFVVIRCRHSASESCEVYDSKCTWSDKLIDGPSMLERLQIVHKTRHTWRCILLDQDKLKLFDKAMKDCTKYGTVLYAKLNEEEVRAKKIQFNLQYNVVFDK